MIKRFSLALALVAACLHAPGCRSGELFDPDVTTGRIAGELSIIGPTDSNLDLYLGVTRKAREDTIAEGNLGHVASVVEVSLDQRVASYDFTGLPVGSYNLVLFSRTDGANVIHYRSGPISLDYDSPEKTGLAQETSLTGPGPWGTASGALYLSGVRPPDPMLELFVEDSSDHRFHYDFNAWDAGFGVLYFSVGGLAYGDYGMGVADPPQDKVLGRYTDGVSLTKAEPDAGNISIWAEYPDQDETGEGYSIGGTVAIDDGWPANYSLAVIAVEAGNANLGTSPIYHVTPRSLEENGRARFVISSLSAGTYELQLYALDFICGNHRVIGRIETPLILDADNLFHDDLLLRGDTAGLAQ